MSLYFIVFGWGVCLGFGAGGLHCARQWMRSLEKLKANTDLIFDKYKNEIAKELNNAVEKSYEENVPGLYR